MSDQHVPFAAGPISSSGRPGPCRHLHREAGPGRHAPGRRDHGRGHGRAGQGGRGRRGGGRDGARAGAGRHPPRRRGGPDERPGADRGDPAGRDHPGDGQGPHRALRRGPGARGAGRRLHRRERGPDAGRRGAPHRQVGVLGALRVRGHQPGRGTAADLRGGGHDPLEGRGRHGQHRRSRPPPALDPRRHPLHHPGRPGRAVRLGQAAGRSGGPGPRGRRDRPAARAPVLCRRDRHAGGRLTGHAARGGSGVRGIGHLQER